MAKQKAEEKLGTILEQPRKMTTGAFMLLFSSSPGWERERERERERQTRERGKESGRVHVYFVPRLCFLLLEDLLVSTLINPISWPFFYLSRNPATGGICSLAFDSMLWYFLH